jgi:hypothetical protein
MTGDPSGYTILIPDRGSLLTGQWGGSIAALAIGRIRVHPYGFLPFPPEDRPRSVTKDA